MTHKPTLYIGIGGSGSQSLSLIKKHFEDEYGEGKIPDHIQFLAIDTDYNPGSGYNIPFHQIKPTDISPSEYVRYNTLNKTGRCDWFVSHDEKYPKVGCGTASIRSNARLLMEMDIQRLEAKLKVILSQMPYLWEGGIDIRMVMSLAGGTGSGIFIPLATIISKIPKTTIYGYGILHGIWKSTSQYCPWNEKAFINTYSAICELDYLQHATIINPKTISVAHIRNILSEPLFKEFYLIEDLNEAAQKATDRHSMFKSLSISMYSASYSDTLDLGAGIDFGSFDIMNKKGWVGSTGACEIVYNGDKLAELYALIAADRIAEASLKDTRKTEHSTLEHEVMDFMAYHGLMEHYIIDRIRKENQRDFIIPTGQILEEDDIGSLTASISEFIRSAKEPLDASHERERLAQALNIYLSKQAADHRSTIIFLDTLKEACERAIATLTDESKILNQGMTSKEQDLDSSIDRFITHKRRFLKSQSTLKAYADEIEHAASIYALTLFEFNLRNYAIELFRDLITKAEVHSKEICETQTTIESFRKVLAVRIEGLKEECCQSERFRYNTTIHDLVGIESNIPDSLYSNFIDNCAKEQFLHAENWTEQVMSYTSQLPQTEGYRKKTISEVIASMPERDYAAMMHFIRINAIRMLMISNRGYLSPNGLSVEANVVRNVSITIYSKDKTRFGKDIASIWDLWSSRESNTQWHLTSSKNLRQKILISVTEGYIIPYCIDAFAPELVEKEYDSLINSIGYNPYIDANIYADMLRTEFSLRPLDVTLMPETSTIESVHDRPEHNETKEPVTREKKKKYDVFISSKSDDYPIAEKVYDFLSNKHHMSVFLACRELKRIGEAEYALAIDDALDETEHMIVVVSSAENAKSKWVRYEWSTFENDKKSGYRDGNLIVVRSADIQQKDMPAGLRHKEFRLFDDYEDILYYVKP